MTVASADINLQKNTQCEQNDEETVCVTIDGWFVAVEIMQILAKFPRARRVKQDKKLFNIRDLNWAAFWTLKYFLHEWNIEAKNEIKFPKINLLFTLDKNAWAVLTATTVASGEINMPSKHNLICHVAKVKAATSAHSMADVILFLGNLIFPFNPTPW